MWVVEVVVGGLKWLCVIEVAVGGWSGCEWLWVVAAPQKTLDVFLKQKKNFTVATFFCTLLLFFILVLSNNNFILIISWYFCTSVILYFSLFLIFVFYLFWKINFSFN